MQNGDRVNFTACTNIPSTPSDSTFYAQLEKNRLSIGDVPVGDGRDIVINVVGTQTESTYNWTGLLDWTGLFNGLKISYYLPYENTEPATLNLTFPNNTTTGAIPIYFEGDTRLTNQFHANSTIILTYYAAGSINIDGTPTVAPRWVCSDTIDAIQSIEPSDELGYIETTNTAGHTEKISPYYGTAPSAAQQMPFNFTSVKSSNLEDYTIYGNNNPNRIDETRTTLPMTVSAYGGNATDWEIYGNNNPVVENKAGILPIDVSATAGNLLDYTVYGNNNIGKNLISVPSTAPVTSYGVTFTFDPVAGTVTANGTSTGGQGRYALYIEPTETINVYLSGCPAGGSSTSYNCYPWDSTAGARPKKWDGVTAQTDSDYGDGGLEVQVLAGHRVSITLRIEQDYTANNVVFKPMYRKADTSSTFEPYTVGTGERTKNYANVETGTVTTSGITFTFDHTTGTVTANGTATASAQCRIYFNSPNDSNNSTVPPGNYYFSGTPSGGSGTKYNCYSWDYDTGARSKQWDGTTEVDTDIGQGNCQVQINGHRQSIVMRIASGYTANNVVFKPMLRAADTDAEFIPYGYEVPMQAKQRTKNLFQITENGGKVSGITYTTDIDAGTATFSGTCTSSTYSICPIGYVTFPEDTYVYLSGGADGGSNDKWYLYAYDMTAGARPKKWDGTTTSASVFDSTTSEEVLCPAGHRIRIAGLVRQSVTVNNIVFEPMLRPADTSADFEPYYNINQTDIYIGSTPLTQGQSITKAQSGQDITLFSGDNIIDTTLYNKPNTSITYNSSVLGVGEFNVPQVYTGWEQGTRTTSAQGGETYSQLKISNTARVRNADLIPVVTPFYYEISSGYQIGATFFDENGLSLGTSSNVAFRSSPYTYTGVGKYVSFVIKNDAETDITPTSDFVVKIASPYGYQIPLSVISGQTTTPYNYYIGNSPLTAGQSISKTSTGTDIALLSGTNTISTTLGNKPEMRIDYESAEVGVGIRTENLLEITAETQTVSGVKFTIDKQAGTVIANGTPSTTSAITCQLGAIDFTPGDYILSGCPAGGDASSYRLDLRINKNTLYANTVDNGSGASFQVTENTTLYVYARVYGAYGTFNDILFKPMVRTANSSESFIPYGYQIPISVSQQSQILDTKNIYIGTSLLTQGQAITKTQAGVDIYAPRGVDTMDSTLYNKPSMSLVATCGIDGYIDSKLNTFDTQQVIPKIQALHDKLKLDMDRRFGFPNGGYNWIYDVDELGDDIILTNYQHGSYEISLNSPSMPSYSIEQPFNTTTTFPEVAERYARALPEGDYRILVACTGWTGTAGAATFSVDIDVIHDGGTTTKTISESSSYYYWESEDINWYYEDIHVGQSAPDVYDDDITRYDAVTLTYNFASSTANYSAFDGGIILVFVAELSKFESDILPDMDNNFDKVWIATNTPVATDINQLKLKNQVLNNQVTELTTALNTANTLITSLSAITNAQGAGAHSAIYRGKALGSTVTSAQYDAIDAGTFDDLYIGDYWTINGVNWRIAALDYYYRTGDLFCATHHVIIVPDTHIYTAQYHITESGAYESGTAANTTAGGYYGADLRTGVSSDGWDDTNFKGLYKDIGALGMIKSAFGAEHILIHRQYLVTAVSSGHPSAGWWYDSQVELMTEQNVYGCKIFGPIADGSDVYINHTLDKSQFPLFALDPTMINAAQAYWLRDAVSASQFANVEYTGCASCGDASLVYGVRPAFAICKANPT